MYSIIYFHKAHKEAKRLSAIFQIVIKIITFCLEILNHYDENIISLIP